MKTGGNFRKITTGTGIVIHRKFYHKSVEKTRDFSGIHLNKDFPKIRPFPVENSGPAAVDFSLLSHPVNSSFHTLSPEKAKSCTDQCNFLKKYFYFFSQRPRFVIARPIGPWQSPGGWMQRRGSALGFPRGEAVTGNGSSEPFPVTDEGWRQNRNRVQNR